MKQFYILIILFVLFIAKAQGQTTEKLQHTIDSLESQIKKAEMTDDNIVKLYDELCNIYAEYDINKLYEIAKKGILVAKERDISSLEADMLKNIGLYYMTINNYDSATIYYENALKISRENKNPSCRDTINMMNIFNQMAVMASENKDFNKTIEYLIICNELAEQTHNINALTFIQLNIITLFTQLKDYESAEKYLVKMKSKCEKKDSNQEMYATYLIAQSSIYFKQRRYDEAIEQGLKAVEISDSIEVYRLTIEAYLCIGNSYYEKENYKMAMEYAEKAIELSKKINSWSDTEKSCNILFCMIYLKTHQYDKAIEAGEKAYVSFEDGTYNISLYITLTHCLTQAFIAQGNKIKAEKFFNLYCESIEKLTDTNIHYSVLNTERKYQAEKKELQIQELNKQQTLYRKYITTGSIAVLLLICTIILGILIMRHRRLRTAENIKQLEQDKKFLAAQALLYGENQERTRLSQELHDGIGGLLTMLKLYLEQMKKHLQARSEIDKTIELTDKAISEIRNLAHSIMPDVLQHSSLNESLAEFCSTSPLIHFHFYGQEPNLESDVEINVYRIACELINNALKHADATQINAQLIIQNGILSLSVQDNGKGFDTHKASGFGLESIRSRAAYIGAQLYVSSQMDDGAEFTLDLYLTHKS